MIVPLIGGTLAALGGLEGTARLVYRNRYAIPYRPRIYGDYRYREFIEKAAAPLGSRMKTGYRSRCVTVNRFGLRGPEPEPDGSRRRVLVIGESDIFGVKLDREETLWSRQLQERLEAAHPGRWEVLNGGHPGYNTVQHRHLWESGLWDEVCPDLLLLRFGGNDLSQAYAMQDKWKPGAGWPVKFLWAMNSVQTPAQRILLHSCLYYMGPGKALFRRAFGDVVKPFREENWEPVRDQVLESHCAFIDLARRDGIPVAVLSDGSLEHCLRTDEDRMAMDALNENWRAFKEGYGPYYEMFQQTLRERCGEWGVPFLDLREAIASSGRPGTLFFDGVHWNPKGHDVVAGILETLVDGLGWWRCD